MTPVTSVLAGNLTFFCNSPFEKPSDGGMSQVWYPRCRRSAPIGVSMVFQHGLPFILMVVTIALAKAKSCRSVSVTCRGMAASDENTRVPDEVDISRWITFSSKSAPTPTMMAAMLSMRISFDGTHPSEGYPV